MLGTIGGQMREGAGGSSGIIGWRARRIDAFLLRTAAAWCSAVLSAGIFRSG
jgi:hypothetical protein